MNLHLSLCVAFIFTIPLHFSPLVLIITLHHTLKPQMWPHDKVLLVLECKCIILQKALVLLISFIRQEKKNQLVIAYSLDFQEEPRTCLTHSL